jgi:hypothetical protein
MSDGWARTVWAAAVVAAVVCSACAASGATAAKWSEPATVSPAGQYVEAPRVAIDERGDVAVVWVDRADGYHTTVQLSVKSTGGSFSPPVTITEAAGENTEPVVALGPEGQVIVVWQSEANSGNLARELLMFSSGSIAGGAFSPPQAISGYEGGNGSMYPDVAIDEHGEALAVWVGLGDGGIHYATRAPGADGFSVPGTVTNPGSAMNSPSIAIAQNGAALAAWMDDQHVYAAAREAGDAFGGAQTIEQAPCLRPGVNTAIDEGGEAVVSWTADNPKCEGGTEGVRASYHAPGQPFETPGREAKMLALAGGVAVSPKGKVTLSGPGTAVTPYSLITVTRTADGSYGSPEAFSEAGEEPVLAYDTAGNLYAATDTRVWEGNETPDSGIVGNVAPAQGGFGPESSWLQTVRGELDLAPVIAAAGNGHAAVVWATGLVGQSFRAELSTLLPESLSSGVPSPGGTPESPGPAPGAFEEGAPHTSSAPIPSTAATAQREASPTIEKLDVTATGRRLLAVSGRARNASLVVVRLLQHGHILRSAHARLDGGRFRAVLSVTGLARGRYRIEILLRSGRWERAEQRWATVP